MAENKEVEMDVQEPSRDDIQTQLQEQYLKSLEGLEEGDLIDGKVVQIAGDTVFIDVGYKSEGKLNLLEFGDTPPKAGDIVKVILVRKETHSGDIVISKKKPTKSFLEIDRKCIQGSCSGLRYYHKRSEGRL